MSLTMLFNTGVITINARQFRLVHGPIPQPGNVREPTGNIDEFNIEVIKAPKNIRAESRWAEWKMKLPMTFATM